MSEGNQMRDITKSMVTFPWALCLLIRLENLLPVRVADLIDRGYRAEILPDADEVKRRAAHDQIG